MNAHIDNIIIIHLYITYSRVKIHEKLTKIHENITRSSDDCILLPANPHFHLCLSVSKPIHNIILHK